MTRISAMVANQRGFTMAEVVVSLAVFSVLGAMAQPAFSEIMETFELHGAARQVYTEVQRVRMAAVMENTSCRAKLDDSGNLMFERLDLETNAWEAMPDQNLNADDTADLTVTAPDTITFVPNGGTSSSGAITLTDAGGQSRSISVSASGSIRIY